MTTLMKHKSTCSTNNLLLGTVMVALLLHRLIPQTIQSIKSFQAKVHILVRPAKESILI